MEGSKYRELILQMKQSGILFEEQVDAERLEQVQQRYGIRFPKELRSFYEQAVPVSPGFVNWLDDSDENVKKIRNRLGFPKRNVLKAVEIEEFWPAAWGIRPADEEKALQKAEEQLSQAAVLLPLYSHRFLVCADGISNPPVLSVYGGDIIYYGSCLENWLEIEFCGKSQESVFENPLPFIPGWTPLIS
ncbi:MAG: hypothetical protein Q4F21_07665 [Lachnospiraceae bacterium]|nr:hypothetical protein [Lachnospiraceae bacterium]